MSANLAALSCGAIGVAAIAAAFKSSGQKAGWFGVVACLALWTIAAFAGN